MIDRITIRNYCPDDLSALVALINEADADDKLERATTLEQLAHEMSFPTARPETDCFLAWEGDHLVGYSDLYVRTGDASIDTESTIYSWGVVHPRWRRRGVGRRLLERSYRRAEEYLPELEVRRISFQCTARDVEAGSIALYESLGMVHVRYFVNLARPLNGNLPPLEVPAGFRLRTFDPKRDAETVWQVDNTAFRDHWGYSEGDLGDFLHWIELPHIRPDRGLGTALLVQSLHALHDAGMEAAHLHADADNLTGAMRLYERVGFRVRKTNMAYQKVMRDG
jgi:mycothiol synthase